MRRMLLMISRERKSERRDDEDESKSLRSELGTKEKLRAKALNCISVAIFVRSVVGSEWM